MRKEIEQFFLYYAVFVYWAWRDFSCDHQYESHEGSSQDCDKCGEGPDEPLRKYYFPEESRSSQLSEFLASVIGGGHLDGVDGDSNARRREKIRRS